MKKLAIFDIDGTLFRWQLYHELVFELKDEGIFDVATAEKLDTALYEWQAKKRNWYDYEMEIVYAFEPVIKTLDPAIYEDVVKRVISKSGHKTYAYTMRLLEKLRQDGYFMLAISGSQQEVAGAFAKQLGFDDCIGALYERGDNGFTGEIVRRVPGRKHEIIKEYLRENPDLILDGSVAVGDSDGDISMLEMVTHPIAFNPSPELLSVAQEKGWDIVVERKNVAYIIKRNSDGLFVLEKTDRF